MAARAALPRRRGLLPVLAFCGIVASFLQTLVLPIQAALPELLDAPRSATAWVITATLLVGAVLNPVSGRLGDLYGRRRMILVLLGVTIVGSVVAALANGFVVLLLGRILQGAPFGLIPLALALLRDLLPADRLPTAIGLVSATLGVGGTIGLPLSAVISENMDWHMLFWAAGGLCVLCAALVSLVVPKDVVRSRGRFDPVGAAGLAIGLSGVLLAIAQGQVWGWLSAATLGTALGGLAVLCWWSWFEWRRVDPVVDLRVASRRPVLLTNLASMAMGFGLFTGQVAYPQLLELPADHGAGLGLPMLQVALLLMPSGAFMIVVSPFAGWLVPVIGARLLLAAGGGVVAAAYAISLLTAPGLGSVLAANVCIGVGIGMGYSAMPNLIMQAVPAADAAAANGLNTQMRLVGTAVAGAVIGGQLAAQSSAYGPTSVPTAEGFAIAFLLGGIGAVSCAALALAVPRRRARPDRSAALPDGVP